MFIHLLNADRVEVSHQITLFVYFLNSDSTVDWQPTSQQPSVSVVATVWGSTQTNAGEPMMGAGMNNGMSSGMQGQYSNMSPQNAPKQYSMQGKSR